MQYNSEQSSSIEEAAYDLYVQRGRLDGDDVTDCFEAEKMMLDKSSPAAGKALPKGKTVASKSKKNSEKELNAP